MPAPQNSNWPAAEIGYDFAARLVSLVGSPVPIRARVLVISALLAVLGSAAACRLQPEPPPKPPPAPLEYLGEWGVQGDGPGQLSKPASLAVDSVGDVYIADRGSRFVHKFDPLGHPLLSFQHPWLELPDDIAVDGGGAIYVADAGRSSILIFHPDGTGLRPIRCAHKGGQKLPLGVALDDEGNVFAIEASLHQVQKFNPRGRLVKAWDVPGEAIGEHASPADGAVGPDGFLYVLDARRSRVLKFTREGEFIAGWGGGEPSAGALGGPGGLAVSDKYVFAGDSLNHRVQAWTLDGQRKLTDDLGGHLNVGEAGPADVAVSPRGELLVLDGAHVLRFRINF